MWGNSGFQDAVERVFAQEIQTAVQKERDQLFKKIELLKTNFKDQHFCGDNDGEQDCECYLEGLNRVLSQLNYESTTKDTKELL